MEQGATVETGWVSCCHKADRPWVDCPLQSICRTNVSPLVRQVSSECSPDQVEEVCSQDVKPIVKSAASGD